ncbi:MAG: dihydrofolate reductase [Saprospiraceae bacterium]|nr:dihydrofolate reductase [Saprospiraceae bacterium]
MPKIVYYVATSLDGYISGQDGDISMFATGGEGVDKYLSDLAGFGTVIMGRKTYEFGYHFGLLPGQPAYPHMQHHVFSNSLQLDNLYEKVQVEQLSVDRVKVIRDSASTDVYLCGGGQFAGWLLDNGLIDQLKMKLNPIVLGVGIPLFGNSKTTLHCKCIGIDSFTDGLQILTYDIHD